MENDRTLLLKRLLREKADPIQCLPGYVAAIPLRLRKAESNETSPECPLILIPLICGGG